MQRRNQPKNIYSHSLNDVDLIEKSDYVIVKHKDPTCPRRYMRMAFNRKQKSINEDFSNKYEDLKNLKIENYKENDEHKSPNTVKFSLIDDDNLSSEIKKKKLLELTKLFLTKHKPGFFSPYGSDNPSLKRVEPAIVVAEQLVLSTQLEKNLQKVDQEYAELMTLKNQHIQTIHDLSKIKEQLTTELANYDMLKLREETVDTEIDLMNAKKSVTPLFIQTILAEEIESFRQQLMAKEHRVVDPEEVIGYFGADFLSNHLFNLKNDFINHQTNVIQDLQNKLDKLKAMEAEYSNYREYLQQFEIQHRQLCTELEDVEQKLMCKEHDRNVAIENYNVSQQDLKKLAEPHRHMRGK